MDTSEFVQHLLHLIIVDGRVVVGETVARLRDTMEHQQVDAVLPRVGTASDAVEHLIILQPQGGIPGLPVCPSVEGRVSHAWFVCCVYPSRSANQSRSLMCQIPHCPALRSSSVRERRNSRSRFSCSNTCRAMLASSGVEAKMPLESNFIALFVMCLV